MLKLCEISGSPEELYEGLKSNAEKHRFYNMYTSMDRAMCLLLTGDLYISNGQTWNDVPDRELMKNNYSYGICFSCSTLENIAMWMLYSGNHGKNGAMIKIPTSIMLEILQAAELEPMQIDTETQSMIPTGTVLKREKGDFDTMLTDVVYFENISPDENNRPRVKLSLGEDHGIVSTKLLEHSKVFYKQYAWHYEKECRLIVTLSEKWRKKNYPLLRIKLSPKILRELKNRVVKSPIYEGVDFGSPSMLTGKVDWNL